MICNDKYIYWLLYYLFNVFNDFLPWGRPWCLISTHYIRSNYHLYKQDHHIQFSIMWGYIIWLSFATFWFGCNFLTTIFNQVTNFLTMKSCFKCFNSIPFVKGCERRYLVVKIFNFFYCVILIYIECTLGIGCISYLLFMFVSSCNKSMIYWL